MILFPRKGKPRCRKASLMPFGNLESLPTRSVLMATRSASRRSSFAVRRLQMNAKPALTSLIAPTSAGQVSLRAAI